MQALSIKSKTTWSPRSSGGDRREVSIVSPQPGHLEATCRGQAAGVEETWHHRPGSLRKPRSLEGGRPAAVPGDRHVATPARTGTPGTFCARADAHRLLRRAMGAC